MDPVNKIWDVKKKTGILDKQAEDIKKPARKRTSEDIVKDILEE